MTFWLERKWQCEAIEQVKGALNDVNARLNGASARGADWTSEIKHSLAVAARAISRHNEAEQALVCAHHGAKPSGGSGEWMFDFCCWLEARTADGVKGFLGLPIVAESEWGAWKDIWDDFDKLGSGLISSGPQPD